jgi:hypothetical protein
MSPFSGFENAKITFTRSTGELGRDGVGNAIALTESIEVSAILKRPALLSASKRDNYPGVDASATKLEGCCVEPMILPEGVEPGNWFQCRWSDLDGWFLLESPINPPHGRSGIGAIEEETRGTKIVGWFQISRAK